MQSAQRPTSAVGRIDRGDQRRKAAMILERGWGDQRVGHDVALDAGVGVAVGGPRSGCNSGKEGAWPQAGLVSVGLL